MDALLASFFIQSALACVFLVALWGIVFIYRRPLHKAMAIGWSVYLVHILASLVAAWFGRSDPLSSRQWSTATVQLLAVLGACLAWHAAVRILAGREKDARVPRPPLLVASVAVVAMIGASAVSGRILHQPGSGPLGWLYPIPYLVLAVATWRASRTVTVNRRALEWMAVVFLLFVIRLVLVTRVLLPEARFADATLTELLAVATAQLVQMVAVGVISVGVAVTYERNSVMEQNRRMHLAELRLQRSGRLEMVGRMAAGIAHDFNNVLAVISGGVELARASLDQPPVVKEELDGVEIAIDRASQLTSRLLTFARTGHSAAAHAIEIDETIRGTGPMFERLVGAARRLTVLPDAAGARVDIDRTAFEQVLLNLVVNARDATSDQGSIAVTSRIEILHTDKRVHEGVLSAGRYACVTVEDSGTGIPAELVERIFEPFFTTKGERGGTGVGLATVQQIVLAAHGDIEITSAPETGTRFDVYLPLCA
jgi:signal transduction histidine kinase